LQQGLSNCGVLSTIRSSPHLFKPVFTPGHSQYIAPEKFLDELCVEYSSSQLLKAKEIDVFKYFCDFIDSLDSEQNPGSTCYI
jgi:hypothetical protein